MIFLKSMLLSSYGITDIPNKQATCDCENILHKERIVDKLIYVFKSSLKIEYMTLLSLYKITDVRYWLLSKVAISALDAE